MAWSGWLGLDHVNRSLINFHNFMFLDLGRAPRAGWRENFHYRVIKRTEERLARAFNYFCSASCRVADEIKRIKRDASVTVVPFGFDAAQYPYVADSRRSTAPTITLIGSMSWYPSYSAAVRLLTRLFPEVKRRVPPARLRIVGWSARSQLQNYLKMDDVEIQTSGDLSPFEQSSIILYAPVSGSGIKVKVLEAMSTGTPVVTTSEGVEGLPAEDGIHAGVCDDDAGLIERTVALLSNREYQNRMRRAARGLVEQHCNPHRAIDAMEAIYSRMLPFGRLT